MPLRASPSQTFCEFTIFLSSFLSSEYWWSDTPMDSPCLTLCTSTLTSFHFHCGKSLVNCIIVLLLLKEFNCRFILPFSFQLRVVISQVLYGGCHTGSKWTAEVGVPCLNGFPGPPGKRMKPAGTGEKMPAVSCHEITIHCSFLQLHAVCRYTFNHCVTSHV